MITNYSLDKYDFYVNEYKKYSIENNHKISLSKLTDYNLPNYRWFIRHCPDQSVKSWDDFLTWIGFYSPKMPKEKAAILIYNFARKLGRPIMYDDFRGTNPLVPGIHYINAHWGTMNKMKQDLGLEINQEDMVARHLSKEEFVKQMNELFSMADDNHVEFITRSFIDSLDDFNASTALDKYAHDYFDLSLAEYIQVNGHQTGKQGCGCIYEFEDGEKTYSQYEYLFSLYLRQLGLKYNTDYFRAVRYSTFIDTYNGAMDIDYVIHYNGNIIYIEIPGIIEYYKTWYYSDRQIIQSKSKERYRLKLKEKEDLLKSQGLDYFLLFPCDLTKDNLTKILNNPSNELRLEIQEFVNYNICWNLAPLLENPFY